MHKQRIFLLVAAALLVVFGLFIPMGINMPNPGDNYTVPLFAIAGAIVGALTLIGNREGVLPIWSKIIITIVNMIVAIFGLILPSYIKGTATQVDTSNSSDGLSQFATAVGNTAKLATNTQPQATSAPTIVALLAIVVIVLAWVFRTPKSNKK